MLIEGIVNIFICWAQEGKEVGKKWKQNVSKIFGKWFFLRIKSHSVWICGVNFWGINFFPQILTPPGVFYFPIQKWEIRVFGLFPLIYQRTENVNNGNSPFFPFPLQFCVLLMTQCSTQWLLALIDFFLQRNLYLLLLYIIIYYTFYIKYRNIYV